MSYNSVWSPHTIDYDPYLLQIHVDGVAPFKIHNSAGDAFVVAANSLNCTVGGTLTQLSDGRLKRDVEPLPYSQCQQVFDAVEVRKYRRIDHEKDKIRCGFVAEEVKNVLPDTMQNVCGVYNYRPNGEEGEEEEYLGIDYARLASVVLWGVLKVQQARIDDLTSRISALENQGKKTKK